MPVSDGLDQVSPRRVAALPAGVDSAGQSSRKVSCVGDRMTCRN